MLNRNRSNKKGGGVAAYVSDHKEINPGDALFDLGSDVESLWFEIKEKNRNSGILIDVFYQRNF